MSFSLHTLPVEIVYRILDHLNKRDLFQAVVICHRLNMIVTSYKGYQVKTIEFDTTLTYNVKIVTFFVDNYNA